MAASKSATVVAQAIIRTAKAPTISNNDSPVFVGVLFFVWDMPSPGQASRLHSKPPDSSQLGEPARRAHLSRATRSATAATATPQALARAARSESLALALAACSTCSSGHRQISFDRAAQKEAEAIWGGARFCLGFGWQLYPSRVHRDLFFFEISETIWGVRAFCANTSHLSIGIFFFEISETGHRFKKKRLFSGAFLEPRV